MQRPFDAADAAISEIDAPGERLHPRRERLHLEAEARHLRHESLHDRVVQCVPLRLPPVARPVALGRLDVQPRLQVQRANERVRVEEELQQRVQQLPDETEDRAVRVVERRVLEGVDRLRGQLLLLSGENVVDPPPQCVEELGLHRAGIEDVLEPPRGEFVDLLVREVHTLALGDACANLAHDLLDVDLIVTLGRLRLRRRAAVRTTPVVPAAAAMEVSAPPVLVWFHCQYFLKSWPHSVRMKERMRDRPMVGYQSASW